MVNQSLLHFENFPQADDPAFDDSEESSSSDSEDDPDGFNFKQPVQLRKVFELDRYGCYGQWCIFLAAAKHNRWEELLIPVPPYHYNGRFDINWLLFMIDNTPNLTAVHIAILEENYVYCNSYIILLLHSVFIKMGAPFFHTINNHQFQKVIKFSGLNMNGLYPTDVFDLHVEDYLVQRPGFPNIKKFGFYGTSPARFYSILFNGFVNNMKSETEDEPVEAERIHLTTDFSVSLSHSDKEPYWYDLRFGAVLRCVALCEYIDHPSCVQYKKDSKQEHTDIFIKNGEAIRIRLMLFFKEIIPALPPDEPIEIVDNTHQNEEPEIVHKTHHKEEPIEMVDHIQHSNEPIEIVNNIQHMGVCYDNFSC